MIEKFDIYFWALMAMGVFIMYYVYIVYGPTLEILEYEANQTKLTISQNKKIIDNQNNNSEAIKDLVQENRENQDQAVAYLISILNQSNIIGNATADLILESIANVQELETNQTKNSKEILRAITENRNITLSDKFEGNGFQLFRPASYGSGLDIAVLNLSGDGFAYGSDNGELSGNISGFLGGPMLTNETIPFELRNLTANVTTNKSR